MGVLECCPAIRIRASVVLNYWSKQAIEMSGYG